MIPSAAECAGKATDNFQLEAMIKSGESDGIPIDLKLQL